MEIEEFRQFVNQVYDDIYNRDDFGYFDIKADISKNEFGYTIIETFVSWKEPEKNKNIKVIIENAQNINELKVAFKTYILGNWKAYLSEEDFDRIESSWI